MDFIFCQHQHANFLRISNDRILNNYMLTAADSSEPENVFFIEKAKQIKKS